MSELMLEADSGRATYEQVIRPVVPMRDTSTYQPISNIVLLNMLKNVAEMQGLELKNPEYGLARKGQRMFGVFEVEGHDHLNGQVKMMMGVRNAFDGTLSAGICFGSKVFVCSNLVFTGYAGEDVEAGKVTHKHTRNIEDTLHQRLKDGLTQVQTFKNYQQKFYDSLKKIHMSDNEAYATIVRAVQSDAMPNKDVVKVARIWDDSGDLDCDGQANWHKDFYPRNAWSLFNVFTENHKQYTERNPFTASQRSIRLSQMFSQTFMN